MKHYYEIVKSWLEVAPIGKIRYRRIISAFKYETYEDAHKVAVEIRKKDPYYRYDLGDRIYVRRSKRSYK